MTSKSLALVSMFALASFAAAQDGKIVKQLSPEQTEEVLKREKIEFKKVESKTPTTTFFDYQRNSFNIRLYNYDGKDLMLDAVFPALPLEKINQWNMKAKFSRAVLNRDAKGQFTTIESNLDLIGGVTEGGLKQFFNTFDEELRLFTKFAAEGLGDDKLFATVTGEKLESILKGLNIAFERNELKNGGGAYYDFEANNFKIRLVNFGGKDLMIDAHFKKIPLEDINRWNLEKKFIRAVSYSVKGQEYSALEANLDCEVGTTDGILRNFIVGFQEDVKQFAKFCSSVE